MSEVDRERAERATTEHIVYMADRQVQWVEYLGSALWIFSATCTARPSSVPLPASTSEGWGRAQSAALCSCTV